MVERIAQCGESRRGDVGAWEGLVALAGGELHDPILHCENGVSAGDLPLTVSAVTRDTEGGELFLGIDEDKKSRPRVATEIDDAPAALAPERLQQLIQGNVSPYLPGIRLQRVRLSNNADKVVFVVQVPHGSTAYQAKLELTVLNSEAFVVI
jgi:hypothetical protein